MNGQEATANNSDVYRWKNEERCRSKVHVF